MKLKHIAAAAALVASGSAFAGVTGNVGVFSDYVFRGITQTGGEPAVQGGIDYSHASGLYVGTWTSNISGFGGGSTFETDFYGGFAGKAGDLGYDVGLILYYYPDGDDEETIEYYGGLSYGALSGKLYYADDVADTGDSNFYLTASYAIALSDSLALTPQVGYTFGDASDTAGDEIVDFSLTLAKTLEGGLTFSLAVTGTDSDITANGDETVVVGLKKAFDL